MKNEITIYQKHFHALICKVLKSLNTSNPDFMWSYFTFKNMTHNFRNDPLLKLPAADLHITALLRSVLGHAYCRMVFPCLFDIMNPSLNRKENLNLIRLGFLEL